MSAPLAFDLDGTLVENRERQLAVTVAVLAERGIDDLDRDRFWELKRGGLRTGEALAALGLDRSLAGDVQAAWSERVEGAEWLRLDRPLPGAARALELARDAGHSPLILTARRDADAVRAQLATLGLEQLVEGVHVVHPAEAAAAKAHVLGSLGAAGFVGDSETDADAAATAGVLFAAVTTGQRSPEFLESRGIEPRFARVDDATQALLGRLTR